MNITNSKKEAQRPMKTFTAQLTSFGNDKAFSYKMQGLFLLYFYDSSA